MNVEEVKERAFDLLLELGFPRNVMSLSPFKCLAKCVKNCFNLSYEPDVIVLDEPTAIRPKRAVNK